MAIRVTLECGHTSMLRMRTTPEGYTHDWEVFVRGADNADIHHYIEKVVFHLHDTFRNPKRVLKEPPFVVKESGYAGFIIPIEVYLKNKDEPKKFQITYDLHLQPSGPPINNAIRHTEVIRNPSDEFRKKLLKGGGVVVSSRDGSLEKNDAKTSTMVGKPKLNGSENKKHRISESKTSNSFHDLFGPPIKTAKISPDSKKTSQSDKNSIPKPVNVAEKSDKVDKTIKAKESPHKDSRKDKIDDKKDKKIRDSSKDQLKSKEKSKRPPSPGSKNHSSPGSKRPASPVALKKSSSPSPSSTKRPPSPKLKEKDIKKNVSEKEKEKDSKEKDKAKNNSKSDVDLSKSDKKKDRKKHKDDRDKERKDKYKEAEKASVKDAPKLMEKKAEKADKEKSDKEKPQEYKSSRDGRKSPKSVRESDKVRDDKSMKVDKPEKSGEKSEKMKDGKSDKDRQKHKHKKRDKKDKRDSKDREKKEKQRSKEGNEKQGNVSSASTSNIHLSTLLTEMSERDSSDSAPSVDDDLISENKSIINVKKESEHSVIPIVPTETSKPLSPVISTDMKKDKNDRNKKDKSKCNKNEDRENRKRKKSKEDEEEASAKKIRGHSTSPALEPVSSSQSPVTMDVDPAHHLQKEVKKDVEDDRVADVNEIANNVETDVEQVAPDSTNNTDVDIDEPPVFTEDYLSELKDLQRNIMTLQDNEELHRVVQVIAETGQYEITKKTFDFDLCALDRRTIHRLQQFFSTS
ncbi:hypothetical protein HN011_002750 [Eciton burchellii]|nr:hypothetical protein HN011_002750 [Eciton burchellii]